MRGGAVLAGRELAEALQDCRCIAVLIGPNGSGPWHAIELRDALQQAAQNDKPVFPILLPGAEYSKEKLPAEFKFLNQWPRIDLSAGFDDAAIGRLAQAIQDSQT